MTKGKKLSRALPKWITTGSITGGVWTFEQADGIAVLTDEIEQIGGLKNHRGGILIWMDADEPRSFQKGSFQKKRNLSFRIVEQAERGHGSCGKVKNIHQIIL